MDALLNEKLGQDLEAAVAAYQRANGRPATILRLRHLLTTREAAQRLMDEAIERAGAPNPRAAE